jgi:GT2 family glycosyltransferase
MGQESVIALQNNETPRTPTVEKVPQEKPLSVLSPSGLASILVPCCGQLEYTKLCVPALLRHTRQPYELIFIDIGSLDGTSEYLAGAAAFAPAAHVRMEVVRTPTDLGIPKAIQDAIKLARGEYVVLLNNDTIVTHGWLNQLIALVTSEPHHGMAGPMSNYAAPPQLVDSVPYRIGPKKSTAANDDGNWLVDVSAVEVFARQWREENRPKWFETQRLGGFCLLMKRDVLKRIGHLREAGDLALFDTDILSAKARQAGFTLVVCKDLFVHHFGTRTFAHGAPATPADQAKT